MPYTPENLPHQPPPHIMQLLEPAAYTPYRSPLRDPQDPNYWWRLLPNANMAEHTKPLGTLRNRDKAIPAEEAVETADRHFEFLSTLGIKNPIVEMYLTDGGRNRPRNHSSRRLFTLNDHVTGLTGPNIQYDVPELKPMLRLIGSRLLEYTRWVEKSISERYILWDIFRSQQYIFGTTARVSSQETFLIDTDPFLSYADGTELLLLREGANKLMHK